MDKKPASILFICLSAALALILGDAAFPESAHAYINPGSGSYIIQLIMAIALGGLLTRSSVWQALKGFFRKLFPPKNKK